MLIWVRLLLVILSSCLGIMIYPSIGIWWLVAVAWIPLILALNGAKASHAMYMGLLHGMVFYGVTLSWLTNIFNDEKGAIIPLIMILSLFTAVFSRGYAVAYKKYGNGWVLPLFAGCWWVSMELIRSEIFYLKFPWMTPGSGLGPMWLSPLVGVYGVGFMIILASALIGQRGKQCAVGCVVMLTLLVSVVFQKKRSDPLDNGVGVMAVQSEDCYFPRYVEMTESAPDDVDLIVWPEYAILEDVRKSQKKWVELTSLAEKRDALIITGTSTDHEMEGWYNTALTVSKEGALGDHYKNHTVHFFDDGIAGKKADAITTPLGKIGTPICFDCDYEDVIRRMVADGAEFIMAPTMDAQNWSEKQKMQHSELFRHRAAENGRWLVVAATSGLTQVIDPYGNRVKSLPVDEDGVLLSEVNFIKEKTVYTKFGWLFPWGVMILGFAWIFVIVSSGFFGTAGVDE